MSNFTKGATYRTAAAQPDMSTRVIEPTTPAIIPLPSDAPAETIARLSVELAASRAQVARMREALGEVPMLVTRTLDADRQKGERHNLAIASRDAALASLAAVRESAPDDIAIPRERYDRMVKALGMGQELERNARRSSNAITSIERSAAGEKVESILATMDAAGKA